MRTFKAVSRHAGAFLVPAALAACSADPQGPGVDIAVAPLTLPGIVDICYGLTVYNGDPATLATPDTDDDVDTVWSRANVCSTQYGNSDGGDITYVGTCDASVTTNFVALVLETVEVEAPGGSLSGNILDDQLTAIGGDETPDFQNPCTDLEPCILDFPCVENADSLVEFNLTVLRRAEQGFFDIAVNFEDVFCSAKVDCVDADNDPITLVHDADGNRGPTLVTAFSCTAGPGADTTLHLDDIVLDCPGTTHDAVIDPTVLGNAFSPARDDVALFQAVVTAGAGMLVDEASGAPASTVYWTAALGLDPTLVAGCTVTTSFTASAGDNDLGWQTSGTRYPAITVDVDLGNDGALLTCEGDNRHGLDDPNDPTLVTTYVGSGTSFGNCATNASGSFAFCPETVPPGGPVVPLVAGQPPVLDVCLQPNFGYGAPSYYDLPTLDYTAYDLGSLVANPSGAPYYFVLAGGAPLPDIFHYVACDSLSEDDWSIDFEIVSPGATTCLWSQDADLPLYEDGSPGQYPYGDPDYPSLEVFVTNGTDVSPTPIIFDFYNCMG